MNWDSWGWVGAEQCNSLGGIVFAQLIDQLVGHDATAGSERPKTIDRLGLLNGVRLPMCHQSMSSQLGIISPRVFFSCCARSLAA